LERGKSVFVARIWPVRGEEAVVRQVESVRRDHKDATHHVYAYRVGLSVDRIERYSDDGEPGGTAGAPVMTVLQREELENVLVVVTRYYGGIPLGASGLVRAYSRAARAAVERAGTAVAVLHRVFRVECDYGAWGQMAHIFRQRDYRVLDIQYKSNITLLIAVPLVKVNDFRQLYSALVRGATCPEIEYDRYLISGSL